MSNVKSAQTWTGLVVTRDGSGALSAATTGPAGALYVNGTSDAASVTITGSNPYKWSAFLAWTGGLFLAALAISGAGMVALWLSGATRTSRDDDDDWTGI
jgi:hypothetical protein